MLVYLKDGNSALIDHRQATAFQFDFEDSDVSVDVQVDVNAFYLVMDQVFDNGMRRRIDGSDDHRWLGCLGRRGRIRQRDENVTWRRASSITLRFCSPGKIRFAVEHLQRRVRSAEGAGLGLALVSQLVDQLGRPSDLGSDCLRRYRTTDEGGFYVEEVLESDFEKCLGFLKDFFRKI